MNYTITDLRKDFPNDDVCLDYIFQKKYVDLKGYHRIKGRKCYSHQSTKHQIHPLKDTIFEKTSTPLTLWFHAIFLFSASKNGVSAKELQRQIGVTYKCAWRMAKQIRSLMEDGGDILTGTVEVDETYVGGRKHGPAGRGALGKTPIVGLVERGGDVRAFKTDNVNSTTLTSLITDNVSREAHVMTDDFGGYKYIKRINDHETIAHGKRMYVRGNVHTNTIEGFWSQFKRSVRGTYVHVSKKHMQNYINEFTFRYNLRASSVPIFEVLLARV
jgi:transposase